jgi:hypothetical protein
MRKLTKTRRDKMENYKERMKNQIKANLEGKKYNKELAKNVLKAIESKKKFPKNWYEHKNYMNNRSADEWLLALLKGLFHKVSDRIEYLPEGFKFDRISVKTARKLDSEGFETFYFASSDDWNRTAGYVIFKK